MAEFKFQGVMIGSADPETTALVAESLSEQIRGLPEAQQ